MLKFFLCGFLPLLLSIGTSQAYRPLLIWHGFNSSCEESIQTIAEHVQNTLPGIQVFCIKIGDSSADQRHQSMFMPIKKQLELACAQVAEIPELRQGFNAFGESQGGLLIRGLVQKCPPGPVNNLVTLSSPHQGIFGIPVCTQNLSKPLCNLLTSIINLKVYTPFVQGLLTAAQYWHDPRKPDEYRERSEFLAEYNNERNFNDDFKQNLKKVSKFIMIRNVDDNFIVPNYSSHFGFFADGSTSQLVNFTSTRVYEEDLLGLKTMFANNQLVFENIPGNHAHLDWPWFEEFTKTYLQ